LKEAPKHLSVELCGIRVKNFLLQK